MPLLLQCPLLFVGGSNRQQSVEVTRGPVIAKRSDRVVWWAGGHPVHHQDLNRLRRAFQEPETTVVNKFNRPATARHADTDRPQLKDAQ